MTDENNTPKQRPMTLDEKLMELTGLVDVLSDRVAEHGSAVRDLAACIKAQNEILVNTNPTMPRTQFQEKILAVSDLLSPILQIEPDEPTATETTTATE